MYIVDRTRARHRPTGWSDLPLQIKGLVVVVLPVAALLIATLALVVVQRERRAAEGSVTRSLEVHAEIQTVLTLLVDAETGMRGYALSGRKEFLEPYVRAEEELPAHLARLGGMVQERPDQAQRLRRVEALADQSFAALIALRAYGNPPPTRPPEELLITNKTTMDALREELAGMQSEEERQLAERTARAQQVERWVTGTILVSLLVGVVGGFVASVLFTTGVVRRARRLEANAHLLARGHPLARLPTGDDEIGRVGQALQQAADLLYTHEAARNDSLQRLAAQTRALEAKTREQDAFLYTVSHDLRAPLVSLQGIAGILAEDYGRHLDGDAKRYIERLSANAARMQTLLDDLLELARVGRDERVDDAVDLTTIVTQVREQLQQTLANRGAVIQVEDPLPIVSANRTRLAQVFTNLIDNAVKYTPPERSPLINIGVADQGDVWELTVRDNGVGIPSEYREKAFSLFQRLPAGRSLNPGGSGAGLAIVARIVEAHGGRCWIESGEEGGTTVHFTLPKCGTERPSGVSRVMAGEMISV